MFRFSLTKKYGGDVSVVMNGKQLSTAEAKGTDAQFVQRKNERKEDDLICVILYAMLLCQ